MMTETVTIAGFGNDVQCVDRSGPRNSSQDLIVLAVPQQFVSACASISLRCRIRLRDSKAAKSHPCVKGFSARRCTRKTAMMAFRLPPR